VFIGLMSGTSVDAVDGVLARFEGDGANAPIRTLAVASAPMPAALRRDLLALQSPAGDELERAALAANALADLYAQVCQRLVADAPGGRAAVTVIGAHGQTVRHRPELGFTLQLMNGARLAESTGIDVVCDFRSADVSAGGQGAPLVPAFHALAFAHPTRRRAIVNIGGIANVSLIEARGTQGVDGADGAAAVGGAGVAGHDTGPGNMLMDAWCETHLGRPYDQGGAWAASGRVLPALLERMLAEPYFGQPPPKSTGRDLFDMAWLERQLGGDASEPGPAPDVGGHDPGRAARRPVDPADVQATLCELTATTIADACRRFGADEVHLCGGGAFNAQLVKRIRVLAGPAPVESTEALGIAPQSVEALAFAWLARERVAGRPANLPAVTGASGRRILGALYPAPKPSLTA
jgi:anhydro-N-acetylmuramic acid kinase